MNIFGVGLPEVTVILILALIIFGPKKLHFLTRPKRIEVFFWPTTTTSYFLDLKIRTLTTTFCKLTPPKLTSGK